MKKEKIMSLAFVAASMLIVTNCFAANAYSVGTKWGKDTFKPNYDYTPNVINAANAYHKLSGYNSYYNTEPTYSYIKSTNRLGNSSIFFINGHASSDKIMVASKNAENYQTGITIYDDGYAYCDIKQGDWIYAGLNGRNMSKTKLIIFAGCETAKGANNLATKAVSQGAKSAVGFSGKICTTCEDDAGWLKVFNENIGKGATVKNAAETASKAYKNAQANNYVIKGNANTTMGTPKKSIVKNGLYKLYITDDDKNDLSLGIHTLVTEDSEEDIITSKDYIDLTIPQRTIVSKNKILNISQKRSKQAMSLSTIENSTDKEEIINIIKNYDSSFNEKDYKMEYNFPYDDDSYGLIYFTYYINNIIETNKYYMITIEDGEVKSISLGGVRKELVNNIKNVDMEKIYNTAVKFNGNIKKEKILEQASNFFVSTDILNKDNTIKEKTLSNDVLNYSEKIFFDYNSKKLKYTLYINHDTGQNTSDVTGISVELM